MSTTSYACRLALAFALPLSVVAAQETLRTMRAPETSALEFSPLSPVINIYAVQYAHRLGSRGADELLIGAAYMAIKYDHGRSDAPAAIIGYRRYLEGQWHVEYQLWPAYDSFYETTEKKYYKGFELWNEVRGGRTFDFHFAGKPVFANVQVLAGFPLYGGNKPESFKHDTKGKEFFMAPMIFFGYRW